MADHGEHGEEEEAAVGSISHILLTAFKDVYDETHKREGAKKARVIMKERAENPEPEGEEPDAEPEPEPEVDDGEGGEGEDGDLREPSGVKEPEVDPVEELAQYYHPFEKLELDEAQAALLADKKALINSDLEKLQVDAKELVSYLVAQKEKALVAEEEEEDTLKKQGVMLGQHIPSLPSRLDVDPSVLATYGKFSEKLMVARELVEQNHENFLRRTGNLPISALAEERQKEIALKMANFTTDAPHYTLANETTKNREKGMIERFEETMKAQQILKEKAEAEALARGEVKVPKKAYKKKPQLTAAERHKNEEILKGINHKLNYLRNPRSDPKNLSKMLVAPPSLASASGAAGQQGHDSAYGSRPSSPVSTSGFLDTSRPSSPGDDVRSSGTGVTGTTGMSGRSRRVGSKGPALFQTVPDVVSFDNYVVGKKYQSLLTFRNVSTTSRSLRVIPPKSKDFSIGPLKFPPNCRGGMVAPGMSVSTVVKFFPDSLGNFKDKVRVETELGGTEVGLFASRKPPKLSLPSTLNVGGCLVGDATRAVFYCENTGGRGRFKVVRKSDFRNDPEEFEFLVDPDTANDCQRMPPFTLYPTCFELDQGEHVDVTVEYVPIVMGEDEEEFLLLVDNCQVHSFTMKGQAREINVSITDINKVAVPGAAPGEKWQALEELRQKKDLFFSPTYIGAESEQEVVVSNDTGLALEFEWVWVPHHLPVNDLRKVGRKRLEQRRKKLGLNSQGGLALEGNTPTVTEQRATTPGTAFMDLDGDGIIDKEELEAAKAEEDASQVFSRPPTADDFARSRGITADSSIGAPGTGKAAAADATRQLTPANFDDAFATLEDTRGGDYANQVQDGPFTLSPCSGTLGVEGSVVFKCVYKPDSIDKSQGRAVLMLRGCTLSSLPFANQSKALNRLATVGHGDNLRLRSWLSVLGVRAKTRPWKKPNGDMVDSNMIVSLNNIYKLVSTYGIVAGHKKVATRRREAARTRELAAIARAEEEERVRLERLNGPMEDEDVVAERAIHEAEAKRIFFEKEQKEIEAEEAEDAAYISSLEKERDRVGGWLKLALTHSINWRRGDLEESEDEEEDEKSKGNGSKGAKGNKKKKEKPKKVIVKTEVTLLDYTEGRSKVAVEVAPVKLPSEPIPPKQTDEEIEAEADLLRMRQAQADAIAAGVMVPPEEIIPAPPPKEDPKFTGLGEVSDLEALTMRTTYVDDRNAILILGPELCEALDAMIQHEAVEFIREQQCTEVGVLNMGVSGEATVAVVHVVPQQLVVGGALSVGERWNGSVTLSNYSSLMTEAVLDLDNAVVSRIEASVVGGWEDPRTIATAQDANAKDNTVGAPSADREPDAGGEVDDEGRNLSITGDSDLDGGESVGTINTIHSSVSQEAEPVKYSLECDPPRVLLMPESSAEVDLSLAVTGLGKYSLVIPVTAGSQPDAVQVDQISLTVNVQPPTLRFEEPDIDFGLLGVGKDTMFQLSFVNEGDVPICYDIFSRMASDDPSNGPSGRGLNSRQSIGDESRQLTARSQASDVITLASDATGKNDPKWARVIASPEAGSVQPGQSVVVNLMCKAGRVPERVRGMLEFHQYDLTRTVALPKKFIALRAEVQSPNTVLYPMKFTLGQCYVGMPVKFALTIENKSNLEAAFKFERPGGNSSGYQIVYSKASGPLGAKEIVHIEAEFTALQPGITDEVIACKVSGVPQPLGFFISAQAKGIQLEFVKLEPGQAPPLPLGAPTDTQYMGDGEIPEAAQTEPLDFGDNCGLYERSQCRVAIRNLSAIPAPFELLVRRFNVGEALLEEKKEMRTAQASRRNSGSRTVDPNKLVIQPHEDGENKFISVTGKKRAGEAQHRAEDGRYLTMGLGAAYDIVAPASGAGLVEPWGVKVVTLTSYNDMPGNYDDELQCTVRDGTNMRKFGVPLKMSVQGCPLFVDMDALGMAPYRGNEPGYTGKQLHCGCACVNAEPLTREFRVRNNGSMPGRIKWNIRSSISAKQNGPIKVELDVVDRQVADPKDKKGKKMITVKGIGSKILFWEDISRDIPFKIEPQSAVVPPRGKANFKVTLFRTDMVGELSAALSGVVSTLSADETSFASTGTLPSKPKTPQASTTSLVSVGSSSTSKTKSGKGHALELFVLGEFLHPAVRMDKNVFVADDITRPTVVPAINGLKLKTQAPQLFARGMRSAGDVCTRPVTVENTTPAQLIFSVSTDGPFVLKGLTPQEPPASNAQTGALSAASLAAASGTFGGGSSLGRTFRLMPRQSESFSIAFTPTRDLRSSLFSTTAVDASKEKMEKGQLYLAFATGQALTVPLSAELATPFIAGSSPRLFFGACHVSSACNGVLLLSNPTPVAAKWTVAHVPATLDKSGHVKRNNTIRVKGFIEPEPMVDEPSVFTISPDAGQLLGPTVSVTAALACPPKDANRLDPGGTIVNQRLVETSWKAENLGMSDTLRGRHEAGKGTESDALFPSPVEVAFKPTKNVRYCSRFRFTCEFGNTFDVMLEGKGTYEEHEHRPINPKPKPA